MQYYQEIAELVHANFPEHSLLQELNPSADVQHCLRTLSAPTYGAQFKEGLAIVVSASPDRLSDLELEHATDNVKQYAEEHGYKFYLQTAQTSKLVHFFSARWLDLITSKMWQQHDWVLHLDGDSIFLDFNKSLEAYTTSAQQIILQVRLNKEVTAAAALMRTTPFAECFVRLWGGKGLLGRANWDNGDLLSTLMDFAAPDMAGVCEQLRDGGDYDAFTDCFSDAHARLLLLANYMPVTIIPPLAGFWKSLEGFGSPAAEQQQDERFKLLMRCWSSDLIGHGSKQIGTWAWWTRKDKNSLEPHCLYNTPEEELQLAHRCCLWHFPGR